MSRRSVSGRLQWRAEGEGEPIQIRCEYFIVLHGEMKQ